MASPQPEFPLLLLLLSFLLLLPTALSAVATIDLGSEWLKVAVVHLRPGHPPISVAINEMSKRKSPSLVAFHSSGRLLAEEAAGIAARFPDRVFSLLRDLPGKPFDHARRLVASSYLPFDLVPDDRGAASIRVDASTYTAEELLAMLLGYARGLAETHSKVKVRDAVVAVPPYFGQAERKALLQAAQLAGLNVLALIHEHAGAALQYGIDKSFLSNETQNVVFYDIGAGSAYAALVQFSSYPAKVHGKSVQVNQFQVKDVRWDAEIGGKQMELRLVEHFADEFNKLVGNGVDIRNHPKAMSKLKKQVKRTKEILSANTAASLSVESLFDDRDFRSTISREKFEELCGDLWDRALSPVKEVIAHSGLKIDEVYAVELIGGASRVPKLQAKLQEFLGRKDLDKHLDADEAIVLGASLHAANLSDGIKLNRKLGMIDGSPYGFTMKVDAADLPEAEKTEDLLVPRMKKLPSKMFRSIKHNKDFEVSLAYESTMLPPGVTSNVFAHFSITGLTAVNEKYSNRNLSVPIKANIHFSLSRSGILSLDRAEAVIEYFEWVELPKKNTTVENSTVNGNASVEANLENNSNDKEKVNADSELKSSSVVENVTLETPIEKKLKKRTFRVPLKVLDTFSGPGAPLSKESLASAKSRLEALDTKDSEKRKTAELKNNLEEYIYSMKEKLEDLSDIKKVSAEEERKIFGEKLEEIQEWLYTDGEDASAKEFEERLDLLKSFGDPIFFRLSEMTARPEACQQARNYLAEFQKIVSDWGTNKTWLPNARVEEVVKLADDMKVWLEEKEAAQKKTSHFSTPAFTSEEVHEKVFDLQIKVASVNRIPKPKPKVEKPPKDGPKIEDQGGSDASNSTAHDETSQPSEEPSEDSKTTSQGGEAGEEEIHDEL